MGQFIGELELRHSTYEKGTVFWTLLSDLIYITDEKDIITVPAGFKTDLASIPRPLWALLPPFWKYSKASVIHDYLLAQNKLIEDKLTVDRINMIFKQGMKDLGVNKYQIAVIYFAVQLWLKSKNKVLAAWSILTTIWTAIKGTTFSWWNVALNAWKAFKLFKKKE
jgi:hypothetical protein